MVDGLFQALVPAALEGGAEIVLPRVADVLAQRGVEHRISHRLGGVERGLVKQFGLFVVKGAERNVPDPGGLDGLGGVVDHIVPPRSRTDAPGGEVFHTTPSEDAHTHHGERGADACGHGIADGLLMLLGMAQLGVELVVDRRIARARRTGEGDGSDRGHLLHGAQLGGELLAEITERDTNGGFAPCGSRPFGQHGGLTAHARYRALDGSAGSGAHSAAQDSLYPGISRTRANGGEHIGGHLRDRVEDVEAHAKLIAEQLRVLLAVLLVLLHGDDCLGGALMP